MPNQAAIHPDSSRTAGKPEETGAASGLPDNAQFVSQSPPPATIRAGQSYPVSVTMKNIGTSTWARGPYMSGTNIGRFQLLSQNPFNGGTWGTHLINMPDAASIAPGQSFTFTFNAIAPATPGSYNFQWQMIDQNVVGVFGDLTPNVVCANPTDDAQFVSQSPPPATIRAGQSYPVSVTMKNIGTSTWARGPYMSGTNIGRFQLLSQNPFNGGTWGTHLINMPDAASIAPGQSMTFTFNAIAPTTPGSYNFQWQMIDQNVVGVFGDLTPVVTVNLPAPLPSLSSLTVSPASVTGGSASTGTVTLSSAAPSGGAVVSLASDSTSATVPASVTVAAGQTSATFPVSTTAVSAAATATITATYGGVSKTAALSITQAASTASLDLAAAATGATKVTLYWNGIAGASGYNVYRSTVSGGPYSLIASNVTTADTGPGMTGNFMYSDTAGLATGTEYFYVVWAVQSGMETVQSNEASDIPQAGAVPWDTGDPVQILDAETTQLNAVLPPDIDPDTGDFIPAEVGLLTVQGPDGVIYESADTEGDPVTAYGPSGSFDSTNNQIVLNDGTTIPVPAPNDTSSLGTGSNTAFSSSLKPAALPQDFMQRFAYQFDPSEGVQREILSLPGYVGLSTTELIFPSPATSPGDINLGQSGKPGQPTKSDSADIYTGGLINGVFNTELDAGLVLASSDASKDLAWQPVTFNYYNRHNLTTPGRPKTVNVNGQVLTGYEVVLLYGDAAMPLKMSFATGGMNPADLQGQVALYFKGQYRKITRNPVTRAITSSGAKLFGSVTLVSPQPQWRWRNRNSMIIKRVSSIAQNIAPKISQLQNGSFMYGGAWGGDGSVDREGQLFKAGQGYVDWDQTPTWLAGGYPYPGNGDLSFTAQIPYHWENHINLSTSFDGSLSAR